MVEIVTLAGSLSDSGEDRVTSVSLGNVVDQLHDKDSLADSGTAEKTDLTSLGVRGQQIDDLDTKTRNKIVTMDNLGELTFTVSQIHISYCTCHIYYHDS